MILIQFNDFIIIVELIDNILLTNAVTDSKADSYRDLFFRMIYSF